MFDSLIANILITFYVLLIVMNTYVFLYQRTVRKVYMTYPNHKELINKLYPTSYITMLAISYLRYILLIIAFFYSWSLALASAILGWILSTWWPARSDYKNILIMKSQIHKVGNLYNRAMIDMELDEILNKHYNMNYHEN